MNESTNLNDNTMGTGNNNRCLADDVKDAGVERPMKKAKLSHNDNNTECNQKVASIQQQQQQCVLPSSLVQAPTTKMANSYASSITSQLVHDDTLPCTTTNTTLGAVDKSQQQQQQQQQEYDEGMYIYQDDFIIDDNTDEVTKSIGILYNTAQENVKKTNYEHAIRWFDLLVIHVQLIEHPEQPIMAIEIATKIHHNIGYCFYRMGNKNDAMISYQKALELSTTTVTSNDLGNNTNKFHVAAAQNAINVLKFHQDSKDCNEIMTVFTECLKTFKDNFGTESTIVATILNNMGRVSCVSGGDNNYKTTIKYYQEALCIRKRLLGNDHIDTAATTCNIAQCLHRHGQLDEALQYYQEFIRIANIRLGSIHKDIAFVYRCIGEIYQEQDQHKAALNAYEHSLSIGQVTLGKDHFDITPLLNRLGNIHFEMNNIDTALQYYQDALQVTKKHLGPCHAHIEANLMNIAQIYRQKNCYKEALDTYIQLRNVQVQVYGTNHIRLAQTLSCMGLMKYHIKDYAGSYHLYCNALHIQRNNGNGDNCTTKIASILNSIGLVLFHQGLFNSAKKCFIECLQIRQKLLGYNHREIAVLCYNIATIYLEQGNDDIAITLYKETLRIEKLTLGNNHIDVVTTLQHLGLVYQRRGEYDDALIYFIDALNIARNINNNENNNIVNVIIKLLNLIGNIYLQKANVTKMMDCYIEASRLCRYNSNNNDNNNNNNNNSNNNNIILAIAGYNFYGISRLHPPAAAVA